jgi:hypothetical protein
MSKRHAPNQYGFTTTTTDPYLPRVGKEAKPNDHFILASAKTPVGTALSLLVRKSSLPLKSAGFSLLGKPVSRIWGYAVPGTPFRALTIPVKDLHRSLNQTKDVIQRVKNHNIGRTVRVLVEAV